MSQPTPVEATVYFVIYPSNTMGKLLCAIHTKDDKALAHDEAVHIGRVQHGDLEIFIYSPVELTTAEAEQFSEHALRMATGHEGTEFMPRYVEPEVDE